MSSVEDLLSMDSSLTGTEYYKDLGFLSTAEAAAAQQMASRVTASFRLSDEANVSFADGAVIITCSTPLCCPVSFGKDTHGLTHPESSPLGLTQDRYMHHEEFGGLEKEDALDKEDQEAFPILVRSMSTSRRYSWESPMSPGDTSRRYSFDASEMDDLDSESLLSITPSKSLNLPAGSMGSWTQSANVPSGEISAGKRDMLSYDNTPPCDEKIAEYMDIRATGNFKLNGGFIASSS
ncbi:uncharacterized protein [Ambystoma mexicanum]|uniref:uncharacterized protein n=1 Tax=Ambystoma mexicanum TaxID=8296 RepID=UPI0037E8818E